MENNGPIAIEELLEQAPQLQRLAAQLARGWDQDDMVQETWLHTLQNPPKNRRNLKSWLMGSLRHRAADHHRREASRRDRVGRLESACPDRAQDEESTPPDLLARTEAIQAVVACLADLEDPFRHTLILHYFEGLGVTEIAGKLGVPKPTISSRLKRGRERLREMMQTRYGGQAFGLCMTAAGPFAPAIVTASPAGSTLTVGIPSFGIALVAVALVVGALAIWMPRPDPAPLANTEALNASLDSSPDLSSLKAEAAEASSDSNRTRQESEPAMNLVMTIRGRCLAAESGAPLLDVPITLTWSDNERAASEIFNPAGWTAPESVVSDSEGRFEIQFVENWGKSLRIEIRPPGRAPRFGSIQPYPSSPSDVTTDFGDLSFVPGHQVRGTVLLPDGSPASRFSVTASGFPNRLTPDLRGSSSSRARVDEIGEFLLEELVPEGTWPIRVGMRRGFAQTDDIEVVVGPQGQLEPIRATLTKLETIRGRVTMGNGNGESIPRVHIKEFRDFQGGGSSHATWSWPDGTFELSNTRESGPIALEIYQGDSRAWKSDRKFEWGTDDLVIHLQRSAAMSLQVTEQSSGQPLEDFAVITEVDDNSFIFHDGIRLAGFHANGHVEIQPVPDSKFYLSVVPRRRGLLATAWQEIDPNKAGADPAAFEVTSLLPYEVHVTGADGLPIEGSRVEVVEVSRRALTVDSSIWKLGRPRLTPNELRYHLVDQARSNEQGVAQIYARTDLDLGLRVTGDHLPVVIYPYKPQAELTIQTESSQTPRVHAELTRSSAWPRSGIMFEPVDSSALGFQVREEDVHWFDADGSVSFQAPQPEEYLLRYIVGMQPIEPARGSIYLRLISMEPPLERVHFDENGPTEFSIDPSAYEPGSVKGRVLIDGAPASGGYVRIRYNRQASEIPPSQWNANRIAQGATDRISVDQSGYFESPQLPPGSATIQYTTAEDAYSGMLLVDSEDFTIVKSGLAIEAEFGITLQGVRLRIFNADGSPFTNSAVTIDGSSIRAPRETDSEGILQLDGVDPEGIQIWSIKPNRPCGTIKPEAGQRWTELELTLPE
jgi:RNA polymerase sigma factor (sigma-70 family)